LVLAGTRFLIYCLSVGCAVLAITTGKKKDTVVCLTGCAVVLFFVDYDRKKKFQSSVWRVVLLRQFLVLAITTGKKKVPVVCLAGCVMTGKTKFQSSPERLRPKKKKFKSSLNLY
jgi:hypothetical protein